MWFTTVVVAAAAGLLPLLGCAAPVTDTAVGNTKYEFDAIIVGGGPSGLAALSALARVRRNVLLVDSGEYRNALTRHMHDVPGFDGVAPAYYRYAARQQISAYGTGTMWNGTVTKIEPMQNNTSFTVTGTFFASGKELTLTARKIILATGIKDLLPSTPGVAESWARGIFWCPWCDGHEHADQKLGILAPLKSVPSSVREILTLNHDLVALVNGTDTPANRDVATKADANWLDYLYANKVELDNRTITSIDHLRNGSDDAGAPSLPTHPEHDLFSVNFAQGPSVLVNALFADFPSAQRSTLASQLNLAVDGAGRILTDLTRGLLTSIPGVYAVGDCNADNSTNVAHALYTGKRTAVFLHVQLAREEEVVTVANFKKGASPPENKLARRSMEHDVRTLWDRMNNEPNDFFYAGPGPLDR